MFSNTFNGCSGLTGSIPENLFSGISGAPAINMFSDTFHGCSGLTGSIPENLFSGISGAPADGMFFYTFRGCSGLTGSIPENLFAGISGEAMYGDFSGTFENCSNLTGFVPPMLFRNITGEYVANTMVCIFCNTGLATSCPPCHTQYITGFEEYWDGKVSCEVSLGENEHLYNGICMTDCGAGFSKIKTSTGLEFPIFTNQPTTPALHFQYNDTMCYAPLEVGNGGTGSMNININGEIYHVGTLE